MTDESKEERGSRVSAAGKPAAIAAFAHISPLGTVGQHLVELRAAQAIAAVTGKAFVFDEGRILGIGVLGFDQKPTLAGVAWPIAGRGLPAVAKRKQPGGDFASGWQGSIGRFHSYLVYCL